jgi:8-oxo-dGTP pyrophosphatase MutT (NUDIX family)
MIWKPHATVAAIIERDRKFLVVEELINGKRLFNQPAGHLDPDESLLEAVVRETREETAWQFTADAVTGIYLWKHPDNGESYLRIAFCGQCYGHDPEQKLDDGILQATWMSRDELVGQKQNMRSPMVIDCIDDYIAGKRYPLDILNNITS